MSSTRSIDELVTFFAGTSPHAFTVQWNPATPPAAEAIWRPFTLRWTTPTFSHELTVAPEQGTATTIGEMQVLLARALCHWLIDHLPVRAYGELLPTLLDMRIYYSGAASGHPQLGAAKALKKLTRSTRPEVDFTEE